MNLSTTDILKASERAKLCISTAAGMCERDEESILLWLKKEGELFTEKDISTKLLEDDEGIKKYLSTMNGILAMDILTGIMRIDVETVRENEAVKAIDYFDEAINSLCDASLSLKILEKECVVFKEIAAAKIIDGLVKMLASARKGG